jgi:hypothetical protein
MGGFPARRAHGTLRRVNADDLPPHTAGELTAQPADPPPATVRPSAMQPPAQPKGRPPALPAARGREPIPEDTGDVPPRRPTALDPQQLGYTPRRGVPWLSPILLAGTAVRVVLSDLFGAYLDKRELQNALPARIFDERPGDADHEPDDTGELWVDYVADLGDGFHATYSIAYLLAQPHLAVEGTELPRGRLLVMGGDQVYPTASGKQYEDRFKGPYRSAMPLPPAEGPRPTIYALPGNHDWYDGLTAFLRLFARASGGRIGGWLTHQARSYFVIQLPNRWWLYAIDAQGDAYIDDPQLRYFQHAAKKLRPGDKVIVCPPNPGWVEAFHDPHAYDTLDYFIRKIIAPTGARVPLMISGDLHHYARYTGPGRELVTAGGGGAYLYPTHRLPEKIEVPPTASIAQTPTRSQWYQLAATFPTRARSRVMAMGVFGRLPWRNPGFLGLLGIVHLLLMLAFVNGFSVARDSSSLELRLVTIPAILMAVIVLGGNIGFAFPGAGGQRRPKHWMLGGTHGVAHLGLGLLGAWLWSLLPFLGWPYLWPLLAAVVLYLPVAGFVASQLVGAYLLVASLFDVNVNELFAGQGMIDAKGFLRLHFAADGSLTVYPVAVDRVSRKWTANPNGRPDQPWFEPAEPLKTHLAEPPFTIR